MGSTYYRAEIAKNGKVIHRLKGRYNNKEQLDAWLKQHWGWRCMTYSEVGPMELKVWKYNGPSLGGTRVMVHARSDW